MDLDFENKKPISFNHQAKLVGQALLNNQNSELQEVSRIPRSLMRWLLSKSEPKSNKI